jgi:hypothetical protein
MRRDARGVVGRRLAEENTYILGDSVQSTSIVVLILNLSLSLRLFAQMGLSSSRVLYFQAILSALSGLTPILTLCMYYKIDFDYMFLLTVTIQCCDVSEWLDG